MREEDFDRLYLALERNLNLLGSGVEVEFPYGGISLAPSENGRWGGGRFIFHRNNNDFFGGICLSHFFRNSLQPTEEEWELFKMEPVYQRVTKLEMAYKDIGAEIFQ